MWAMTRSGVSVEYFDSCESCRCVYLDLLLWGDNGCNTVSMAVVTVEGKRDGQRVN